MQKKVEKYGLLPYGVCMCGEACCDVYKAGCGMGRAGVPSYLMTPYPSDQLLELTVTSVKIKFLLSLHLGNTRCNVFMKT